MYFRLCKICFIFATRKWNDLIDYRQVTGLQPRKKVLKPMLLFTTMPLNLLFCCFKLIV
jgi:hypothetical protein